jgi:O-antigen/teichoic acid export membrane protein
MSPGEQNLSGLRFTVVKNALANVLRMGASAIVALALPHFLTHAMDHDRFAAWVLMLQIAAYANYLDFGLQIAVARYLAQAIEKGEDESRDSLISTTLTMLVVACLIALVGIGVVLIFLPELFQAAPAALIGELRAGTAVLAIGAALLLPLSTFSGVLIGLQRNELPAMAVGISRLTGAVIVIFAVFHTQSLIVLAALLGGCNLAGGLIQYFMARRLLPGMRIALRQTSRKMALELARYCSALTVWSLCMLLVSGLDVTIVGHYDFSAVGAYSVAALLISFLTGVGSAVYSALLAPMAVLQTRGEWQRIRSLVITVTRLSSFLDILEVLAVFLWGHWFLRLWIGESYAVQALPILKILIVANAMRLVGAPLSSALVATNQQRHGISGALAEGVSNFGLSITGALSLGAIGVAWGTLAGAVIGILWVLVLMIGWLRYPIVSSAELLLEGCLRPLLCLSPLILLVPLLSQMQDNPIRLFAVVAAAVVTATLTWRWGGLSFRLPVPAS